MKLIKRISYFTIIAAISSFIAIGCSKDEIDKTGGSGGSGGSGDGDISTVVGEITATLTTSNGEVIDFKREITATDLGDGIVQYNGGIPTLDVYPDITKFETVNVNQLEGEVNLSIVTYLSQPGDYTCDHNANSQEEGYISIGLIRNNKIYLHTDAMDDLHFNIISMEGEHFEATFSGKVGVIDYETMEVVETIKIEDGKIDSKMIVNTY